MSSKNEEDGTQFGTLGACQKVENGDEIFKEGKKAKKKKIQKNPSSKCKWSTTSDTNSYRSKNKKKIQPQQ